MRKVFAGMIVFTVVGGLSSCDVKLLQAEQTGSTPAPKAVSSSPNNTLEQAIQQQINQYRQSRNLPPLTLDRQISEQARLHSQAMANGKVPFSHNGFAQRVEAIRRFIPYRGAAENVAYNQGYSNPGQQAVQGWIKSDGHRLNIEGEYNLTGIGIAKNAQGNTTSPNFLSFGNCMEWEFQVCDRDLSNEVLAEYLLAAALAVDTETMGLLPQRDRLCLVQLCDPQGRVVAIRIAKGQTAAPNLKQLMEAANILKVFHFARFDLATLRYHLGIQVAPAFCTKIASKLARTYTNRHGLKDLLQELEQVELDKSAQSSDWGNAANLSDKQLSYAANDVRYLLNAHLKLIEMLKREERWELAQACFQCLPTLVALDLSQFKDVFEH